MANTIESFIAALKDKNDGVRWNAARCNAAWALVKMGKPAVEPLIAALLKDKYEDVRKSAAWALGKIGDPRAVEPMIAALKDKNDGVRWIAAEALVKMGKPAVEPLIAALKDKDELVRRFAAEALRNAKLSLYQKIKFLLATVFAKKREAGVSASVKDVADDKERIRGGWEYANLAPGSTVPRSGEYRCLICGLLRGELSKERGRKDEGSKARYFEKGQKFTECPNCGELAGWNGPLVKE